MKFPRRGSGPRSSRWRASALLAASCALPVFVPASAIAQAPDPSTANPAGTTFTITETVIAPGGVTRSRSSCFELSGATAQPVAGPASGDTYEVYAGFWDNGDSTDTIFRNGFEACQP